MHDKQTTNESVSGSATYAENKNSCPVIMNSEQSLAIPSDDTSRPFSTDASTHRKITNQTEDSQEVYRTPQEIPPQKYQDFNGQHPSNFPEFEGNNLNQPDPSNLTNRPNQRDSSEYEILHHDDEIQERSSQRIASDTESSRDVQERPDSNYETIPDTEDDGEAGDESDSFNTHGESETLLPGAPANDRASYYDTAHINNWIKRKWLKLKGKCKNFRAHSKETFMNFTKKFTREQVLGIGLFLSHLMCFLLGVLVTASIINRSAVQEKGPLENNSTKIEGKMFKIYI